MCIDKSALLRLTQAMFVLLPAALAQSSGLSAQQAHHHHEHAAHTAALSVGNADVKRTPVEVVVPALKLVREDQARQDLREAIGSGEPVFVNFIFTSCTTVCPVMSETFARLAEETAQQAKPPRLISISIDPEVDTPSRLAAYAAQFGTPASWHLFTGTSAESRTAQKAFGLDIPDKMSHPVATFFYPGQGKAWVRVDGFASPADLAALVPPRAHHHHH